MPRILDDARALLDIDRERIALAREAQAVNQEALATARELAQIGEAERPKAERFAQSMRDAASFSPVPGAGGAGSPLATSSSGGGGGAGAASGGGPGLIPGSRVLTSRTAGVGIQREDWVYANCKMIPGGIEVPNPANPSAMLMNDYVTVAAWDCSVPLGVPEAIFLDPDAYQALLKSPMGFSASGGGGNGGGGVVNARRAQGREGVLGPTGAPVNPFASSTGSSTAGPTADGKVVVEAIRQMTGAVVAELRSSGDIGLQIRRGGL